MESVGEETRWHLLAGTTQVLPKPSTVKMSSVCADAHTQARTDTQTHTHTHPVPSSSSEPPFLLHFLSLPSRKGAAAAAAEVPGIQNAQ